MVYSVLRRIRFGVLMSSVVVLVLFLIIGVIALPHLFVNTYEVQVTEKQVKRYNNSDKYLIFTELIPSGEVRVFENTDTLIRSKFDSSDVYATIHQGRQYRFKVYGFRFRLFSMYENIIKVTPIDQGE